MVSGFGSGSGNGDRQVQDLPDHPQATDDPPSAYRVNPLLRTGLKRLRKDQAKAVSYYFSKKKYDRQMAAYWRFGLVALFIFSIFLSMIF